VKNEPARLGQYEKWRVLAGWLAGWLAGSFREQRESRCKLAT